MLSRVGSYVKRGLRQKQTYRGYFALAALLASFGAYAAMDLAPAKQKPLDSKDKRVPLTLKSLDASLRTMVEHAAADLIERQKPQTLSWAAIDILRAQRVTWRSGALGCALPDRGYRMVLSPGVLIVLRAYGNEYEYHGPPRGTPFLCEAPATIETPAPASSSDDPT